MINTFLFLFSFSTAKHKENYNELYRKPEQQTENDDNDKMLE